MTSASSLLNLNQARELLARAGIDLPANMPPEVVFAGVNHLLDAVPDQIIAAGISPGSEVTFNTGTGVGLIPGSPLKYNVNVNLEAKVKLSDVEIGSGLQPSQTFKASVELQTEDQVALQRTLINRLYKVPDYIDKIPMSPELRKFWDSLPIDQLKDKIEKSPFAPLVKGSPVSGAVGMQEGSRLSYEVTVPPEIGAEIAAGTTNRMPNPLDPMNMPAGSSVLIRAQDLKGSSVDVAYKFGMLGVSDKRLDGNGFGVRKLEGSIVEVYSGPIATIENAGYLGLGKRNLASVRVEFENSLEERQMSVARLDVSTPEGQAAYKQFLSGGQVPQQTTPGVTQVGYSTELSLEQARKIGVYVGSGSVTFDNSASQMVTLSNLNGGTEEAKITYSRSGMITTEATYPLGTDGKIDFSQGKHSIVLPNLSDAEAGNLRAAFGGMPGSRGIGDASGTDKGRPVEMNFDAAQLMQLRERSREYISRMPDGQRILNDLDAGKSNPLLAENAMLGQMAGAKTPLEVFDAMRMLDGRYLAGGLTKLDVGMPNPKTPLPGTLDIQPPASMLTQMQQKGAEWREMVMDKFYRVPPGDARRADLAPPQTTGQPTSPIMQTTLSLTNRDHPDHALFSAIRDKAPKDVTNDQLALATRQAKDAGITADKVDLVAKSTKNPDDLFVAGPPPVSFKTMIDLSKPAPPMEQTSAELVSKTAVKEMGEPQQAQARTAPSR